MVVSRAGKVAVVLAGLALTSITPAYGAVSGEARELLERMAEAVHALDYEGTFIYRHNGHMQTMRIYHGAYDEGEKERLVSLSGPKREVIRDEQSVTCLLPQSESLDEARRSRSFPISVPTNLKELADHYDVGVERSDRVADRETHKIALRPGDGYRYGQNLWIADDTGLPLRAELLDEEGKPVEQLMFTDLKIYEELPRELLEPEVSGDKKVRKRAKAKKRDAGEKPGQWTVSSLPPGFEMDAHIRHAMPGKEGMVEHLVFSDGLASVSVFVEPERGEKEPLTGLSHMGAVHAFGRRIDGRQIIVVGEVPAKTVRLIAEGVELSGAAEGD